MKYFFFATLFLLLASHSCFAQCGPPQYGSINFMDSLYAVDTFTTGTAIRLVPYAKDTVHPSPDLLDVTYKADTVIITGQPPYIDEKCNRGILTNCNDSAKALTYYVYYPKGIDFSVCKLPCIILFHGGGFDDCKDPYESANSDYVGQEFAKRGYVAINVNYRTGRYAIQNGQYLTAQQSLATYRALQDARGAIRTIILHQRQHSTIWSGEPYQIDTTKMFIGGNSAGSIIAIQTAYYDSAQIRQVFPTPPGAPTVKDVLGSIDADYYYGDSTINLITRIRGVLDMWGQALYPVSYRNRLDSFWKNNAKIPPLIGFHGYLDGTLPIDTTSIYFPPSSTMPTNYRFYDTDATCLKNGLTYRLDSDINTVDIYGAGSIGIYHTFHILHKSVELYVDCDMKHGVTKVTDNFGLPNITNIDTVYKYIFSGQPLSSRQC